MYNYLTSTSTRYKKRVIDSPTFQPCVARPFQIYVIYASKHILIGGIHTVNIWFVLTI